MVDEDNCRFPDNSLVEVRYPRTRQEELGDRSAWPWLPGSILSQCGPDEWHVCVEACELAVLDDGSPAPAGTAGGNCSTRAVSGMPARSGVPPTLAYIVAVGALIGCSILVAVGAHVWQSQVPLFLWLIICCLPRTFTVWLGCMCGGLDFTPRVISLVVLSGAAIAAFVFAFVLSGALDQQALQDRGVIETAVVTAEHAQYDPDSSTTSYSYTLHAVDGPPIRGDLSTGSDRLAVGRRVTVLADPEGQSAPSLSTERSARPLWEAAVSIGSAVAIALLVVAWNTPRPVRHGR
jgi:hypothetical protein